jgi:hypothetical protein
MRDAKAAVRRAIGCSGEVRLRSRIAACGLLNAATGREGGRGETGIPVLGQLGNRAIDSWGNIPGAGD